ncbi:hypothetical protein DB30_00633 [Enhygromyxa salina]|uniref:Uncharacterized protein n=1 Tax=Enhygromyxa salina TaxID=215803 RepID=A0A0C2A4N6_9BACT|nr:hypothetical protein DB30_00633 [Enhygromyxa salina]
MCTPVEGGVTRPLGVAHLCAKMNRRESLVRVSAAQRGSTKGTVK